MMTLETDARKGLLVMHQIRKFLPSDFYMLDGYCFHVRRPRPEPEWKAFLRPLSLDTWIASMLALAAVLAVLVVTNKYRLKKRSSSPILIDSLVCRILVLVAGRSYGDALLTASSFFFNQSRTFQPKYVT